MSLTNLHAQPTEFLLQALQTGNLTSRQLTEACLKRIEQFNPTLNAFVSVDAEAAIAQAERVDAKRAAGDTI